MRKALVVVDMQNDFIDGALGTTEAQEMLPRLVEKVTAEQAAGTVLVFTMDTHGADYLQTQEGQKLPVEHCIRGTAGWQIADTLQPFVRGAQIVEKPAFGATDLPALLREYDEIELVGLCTDICVISNALLQGILPREAHLRRCLLLRRRHPGEPRERPRCDADVSGRGAVSGAFGIVGMMHFYICDREI